MTARVTGALYLLTIASGLFAQAVVYRRLVVGDDAAATAVNIATHRSFYELGFTAFLIEAMCNVAITALFYELLAPAGRTLSRVAAFVSLTGCAFKIVSRLLFLAPVVVLGRSSELTAFSHEQLGALAMLLLKLNDYGAGIALAFFGFYAVCKGVLILRSTFLPRALGVLSIVAGVGWTTWLSPSLGFRLFPYVAVLGLIASTAQIVWLLVFGVDEQRWKAQARAARDDGYERIVSDRHKD